MHQLFSWFGQLIQVMLIAYLGFIGPLSYVKLYSPHQGSAAHYALSLFQDTGREAKLAEVRQRLNRPAKPIDSLAAWRNSHPVIGEHLTGYGLMNGLQSLLGHACTWPTTHGFHLPRCLHAQIWDRVLPAHSIDLPPPEEPPSL